VEEVFAYTDNLDTAVDINASVCVRFANGVQAGIVIGGHSPGSSYGAWMFERARANCCPWIANELQIQREGDKEPVVEDVAAYPDLSSIAHFIEAVLGRVEPATTPHHGVLQSELMDAIYASVRSGAPARPAAL